MRVAEGTYEAIHPKEYFIDGSKNLTSVNLSEKLIWNKELEKRYELWRVENLKKSKSFTELSKEASSNALYFILFLVVVAIFIYIFTLIPSNNDCIDADKFGVNQVCGDDIYKK